MVTCRLSKADGTHYRLPAARELEFEYGCGTPCDSFRVVCPWKCSDDAILADAVRFDAWRGEEQVFAGVVDECQVSWSARGSLLTVTGRGMAALLLDNEARSMDYEVATLADILRDHVTPYGIEVAEKADLPAVRRFSVTGGSSEWSVLYQFACYHGGVTPRFDQRGRLILSREREGALRLIGDRTPLTALTAKDKRYGVLSEVWVQERGNAPKLQKTENAAFKKSGGQCRRIYTMPGKSDYQTMRYRGQYQIERSARQRLRLEAEIAAPFFVRPGERVKLARTGWGRNGIWKVASCAVSLDAAGYRTRLELIPPETML